MLNNSLFTIIAKSAAADSCTYKLSLNASHTIFRAHFAGNPTMPGACIVQMIKELAADFRTCDFFISTMKNIKFLAVINPLINPEIDVQLNCTCTDGIYNISFAIGRDDNVFTKGSIQLQSKQRTCALIPTYNNAKTLVNVLNDVLQYVPDVIVVNDGSTDSTADVLKSFGNRIMTVSYSKNRGKGYALRLGFDRAEQLGFLNVITIDSDGQHFAGDIPKFLAAAADNPDAMLLGQRTIEGNMPAKNTFANKFSNFWVAVQTSYRFSDTQNGFRLYPLAAMRGMRNISSRYEAEIELLIRCAWKGIKIIPVPTRVYYAPENEHVSHFRPGIDFFRISLMNMLLTLLAVIYGYPSMLVRKLTINLGFA